MDYTEKEILEVIDRIQKDNPLDSEFESDARYTWPKRWKELREYFGDY